MLASGRALPTRASAVRPRHDRVAHLEPVREEHVALLAVAVVEQADPRRAVRVVLDRRETRGHAELVALEVDPTVVGLLPAAAVAHGHPALVVPAVNPLLRLEERLVRLVGGDLLERRAGHPPAAGRGCLVASERHRYTPSKNSIFWPGASVTMAFRQAERVAGDAAALGAAALLLGLRGQDVHGHDRDLLLLVELLDGGLDLDLVRVAGGPRRCTSRDRTRRSTSPRSRAAG